MNLDRVVELKLALDSIDKHIEELKNFITDVTSKEKPVQINLFYDRDEPAFVKTEDIKLKQIPFNVPNVYIKNDLFKGPSLEWKLGQKSTFRIVEIILESKLLERSELIQKLENETKSVF